MNREMIEANARKKEEIESLAMEIEILLTNKKVSVEIAERALNRCSEIIRAHTTVSLPK